MTEEKTIKLNVYQKLQKARVKLQKSKIKKSGKNAYAGFTYFELKDFIPMVNDLFEQYGLSSNFSIKEGVALLYIINSEKLEEFILFESPIAETQLKGCTAIQALGAAHTYMKRYLYLNALELTEDDLLDKEAGNIETVSKTIEKGITNKMGCITTIAELNKFYEENKKNVNDLKAYQNAYTMRAKEIQRGANNG